MKENNKKRISIITLTLLLVVFTIGITYAFITQVLTGEKQVVINAGVLDLVLEEENEITISDALPMYDQVGMIQEEVFVFRLVNKTSNPTNYILKLSKINADNELSPSDVKYYLTKEGVGEPKLLSTLPSDGTVDSGTIAGNDTIDYTLRLWIDSSVTDQTTISGKSLSYMLKVDASQEMIYKDNSGANYPQLTSGMIPVTYNETDKTWIKADTSEVWYDYETGMWANAVTVTEETRNAYMAMGAGEPISMDDINTMWVWIPRYEYQYTDLGTSYAGGTQEQPGEIKINFISENATTPSDSTKFKIPEGFTFGEENIPGFWMAKFETTGEITEACISEECTTVNLTVKPNLSSIRNTALASFFYASRSMQNSTNASKYGFDVIGEGTMDVHMLKNTEWGIVAMLSQSKYGKYGNLNYTGANKEVYQNKSSEFITGMSNGTPSQSETATQVTYDTPDTGYGASTTGTIYGVYDMSGGGFELVMGNLNKVSASSGFITFPDSKYYDLYLSPVVPKRGDATDETDRWYNDHHNYTLVETTPWYIRGADKSYGEAAGVFTKAGWTGEVGGQNNTFRIVLTP